MRVAAAPSSACVLPASAQFQAKNPSLPPEDKAGQPVDLQDARRSVMAPDFIRNMPPPYTPAERSTENQAVVAGLGATTATGAALGASLGSTVPLLGTAAGAALGGAAGAVVGLIAGWFQCANKPPR